MSRSSPQPTASLLLDAAAEVVAERGLRALTTRSVAARAGVAPGVVHYQLGSIGRLRLRLAEREAAARIARARALWAADAPLADRLRGWLAVGVRDAGDGRARIWRELCVAGLADPELGEVVTAAELAERGALLRALSAATGELGIPAAAAEPLATLLAAAGDGLELQRLVGATAGHAELQLWAEAALRGLTAG